MHDFVIETKRLILEKLSLEDRDEYFKNISSDKVVLESFADTYRSDVNDLPMERYVSIPDFFAIKLKESKKFIGVVLVINKEDTTCEIGYALGRDYWGQGYMTEAVKEFMNYLFTKRNIEKIKASFFEGNTRSENIMLKCGMEYIGTFVNEYVYEGIPRTCVYYGITKGEFYEKQYNSQEL